MDGHIKLFHFKVSSVTNNEQMILINPPWAIDINSIVKGANNTYFIHDPFAFVLIVS